MPKAHQRTEYEIQTRLNGGKDWVAILQAIDLAAARSDLERIIKERQMPRSSTRVVKRIVTEEVVIWAGAD